MSLALALDPVEKQKALRAGERLAAKQSKPASSRPQLVPSPPGALKTISETTAAEIPAAAEAAAYAGEAATP